MDIRQLTPRYAVSPQISVSDIPAIAAAGITTIICNRPDSEIAPDQYGEMIAKTAREAGIEFHILPITHQTLNAENIAKHHAFIDAANGPVLAYCATGNRCTILWALGNAGHIPADEIINTATQSGYNLEQFRSYLEQPT